MEKKLNFESLKQLDAVRLVEDESVKENFISTHAKIHNKSQSDAAMVYERESLYYKKAVSADERLKGATRLSLYSVFMELAINGLSIQPGSKSEAFIEGREVKGGGIIVAMLRITAYGELNMRIMAGQIVRMMNPVVLYEGDLFQPQTNDRGELVVKYAPMIPRASKKIIGVWVRIVLPDNSSDFKWLLEDDVQRLKRYATTNTRNGTYTNALYSSENGGIDPGFLEAKCIKHAMRSYTKLRIGENVAFDDEIEAEDLRHASPGNETSQPSYQQVEPQHTAPAQGYVKINADEPF